MPITDSCIRIRFIWLLGVYAVIPAALIFMAMDHFLLADTLRKTMPRIPDVLVWYQLLFNLPHIFASFFPYMSSEALSEYKWRLAGGSGVVLLVSLPLIYFAPSLAYFMLAIYTVAHVVLQQTGLARMFMQSRSRVYHIWKWSIVFLACYVFMTVYGAWLPSLIQLDTPVLFIVVPFIVMTTYLTAQTSKTTEGKWYTWATGCLVLSSAFSFAIGYFAVAMIVPRIIHDVTAYIFYITHGINISAEGAYARGSLFRVLHLPSFIIPVVIVTLSLGTAYILTHSMLGAATIPAVFFVSLLHYYLDGFAWKNASILRKDIAFQY